MTVDRRTYFISLSSRGRKVKHRLAFKDRVDVLECYDAIGDCGTRSTHYAILGRKQEDDFPLCAKCEKGSVWRPRELAHD